MTVRKIASCPECGVSTPMDHMHDTAHGIPGTHMDGSERYQCSVCSYHLTRDEADSRGLEYVLDKD